MTVVLWGILATANCAPLFDLTNNTGLANLFANGGTDFLDIDGQGLNLNIQGSLLLGTVDLISLNGTGVLRVTSGKRSAVKAEYDLTLTFSRAVAGFYFGTKGTTNQEEFQLDLTPNGSGLWIDSILLTSSAYASNSGLNTPVFSAAVPVEGRP